MNLKDLYCYEHVEDLQKAKCIFVDTKTKQSMVNAGVPECRDILEARNECLKEYSEHDVQDSLSKRCTSQLIDYYDCAYPAGTEQDKAMKEQMWKANLAQYQRAQAMQR